MQNVLTSFYLYDVVSERSVKFIGYNNWVDVNGVPQGYAGADKLTLYASPYMVATSGRYTKHYYAESQRILSKLGGGGLGDFDKDYVSPEVFEKKIINLEHAVRFTAEQLNVRTLQIKPKYSVYCGQQGMLVDLCRFKNINYPEEDRYFYHPDHLGSSSWITDAGGKPIQHLSYLPFGEEFVDQRTSNWSAAYKFTGKEKDEETGYNYFGARYYGSDISMFISVDPQSDKLPSISPYAYCNNNPIKLIDPDGKFPIDVHYKMVVEAFSRTKVPTTTATTVAYGASLYADVFSEKNLHLDNLSDFQSIGSGYVLAKYNFSKGMKLGDFVRAGEGLHTIGDFYSHSNYIDLYRQYADKNGLSMDINDIPTFSEAMGNPELNGFIDNLKTNLKTGTFGEGNVLIELGKDKMSKKTTSHGQMNLDSPNSPIGRKSYNNNGVTMYDAAKATAQKDLNATVKSQEN